MSHFFVWSPFLVNWWSSHIPVGRGLAIVDGIFERGVSVHEFSSLNANLQTGLRVGVESVEFCGKCAGVNFAYCYKNYKEICQKCVPVIL